MSVAVCSTVTEMEEVEIPSPSAKPRLRGRKLVEDEAAGKLQLELLERVEDILGKLYHLPANMSDCKISE
jgi:hypothetical protein